MRPPVGRPLPQVDRAALLASWRTLYDAWTAPIGARVEVTRDSGAKFETRTMSTPWLIGSGTPVIAVAVSGCPETHMLTRVRVLVDDAAPALAEAVGGAA